MTSSVPSNLKPIAPFVLRGRELSKTPGHEVLAYHCFKYAMETGIKLPKTPEGQTFLGTLMDDLERLQSSVKGKSQDQLKNICENFAEEVFDKADSIDQAGLADRSTAQTFYACASFFEILKQFPGGEVDEDLKQKIIYCKWRATEILKASKEGRAPVPPNSSFSGGDSNDHSPENPHQSSLDDIPTASPPVQATVIASSPVVPNRVPATNFNGKVKKSLSKDEKNNVAEYLRYSIAAVNADDYPLAVQRIQQALSFLQD